MESALVRISIVSRAAAKSSPLKLCTNDFIQYGQVALSILDSPAVSFGERARDTPHTEMVDSKHNPLGSEPQL